MTLFSKLSKSKFAFPNASILLILLLPVTSCTKHKTLPETIIKKEIIPEKEVEPDQDPVLSKKILLPIQLGSSTTGIKLKYLENKLLLTEIEQPERLVSKIAYTKEGEPNAILNYKNGKVIGFITYYKGEKGQISKAERTLYNDKGTSLIPDGHFLISYNDKDQIEMIKDYNKENQLLSEKKHSYNTAGNVSSSVVKTSTSDQINYTYDHKNGMFKHVPYVELFFLTLTNEHLRYGPNNLKKCSSVQLPIADRQFSYQYNTDDYPVEITTKKGSVTENLNITYKTLAP